MYLALRAVEVVRRPGELVKVDVGADVHLARVDLHDARAGLLRRRRELDLAVEAAGPEEKNCKLWSDISTPRSYFPQKVMRHANLTDLEMYWANMSGWFVRMCISVGSCVSFDLAFSVQFPPTKQNQADTGLHKIKVNAIPHKIQQCTQEAPSI